MCVWRGAERRTAQTIRVWSRRIGGRGLVRPADCTGKDLRRLLHPHRLRQPQIDKIVEPSSGRVVSGGVSSEGVQRDLLPIIEVGAWGKGRGIRAGELRTV